VRGARLTHLLALRLSSDRFDFEHHVESRKYIHFYEYHAAFIIFINIAKWDMDEEKCKKSDYNLGTLQDALELFENFRYNYFLNSANPIVILSGIEKFEHMVDIHTFQKYFRDFEGKNELVS